MTVFLCFCHFGAKEVQNKHENTNGCMLTHPADVEERKTDRPSGFSFGLQLAEFDFVQQLAARFVCPLFAGGHVARCGFIRAFC